MRKLNTKSEHSTRVGSTLKFTHKLWGMSRNSISPHRESKNAERRHLENVVRKRYTKFEASKSMGRTLKTTYKKRWMEKKKKQKKEDDNILSPK